MYIISISIIFYEPEMPKTDFIFSDKPRNVNRFDYKRAFALYFLQTENHSPEIIQAYYRLHYFFKDHARFTFEEAIRAAQILVDKGWHKVPLEGRYLGIGITRKPIKEKISIFNAIFSYFVVWYNYFKSIIIALLITIILTIICINFFYINLTRQLAIWSIVGLLFLWLISGFNFFLKRYRFGKFTSAVLRFWKRTNAIFWLVEGFLFSLFFYYYLNSSQEPLYFYDTSSLNQDFLNSLTATYINYFVLLIIIWYTYYILLKLTELAITQLFLHLTIITLLYVYMFLLESYQFYYVLTSFYENIWSFDEDLQLWTLDNEAPRLRVKQQYLLVALIAKYWHFLFIFIGWLFFIFKSFEQKRVHYTQFGWNIQNAIILFLLNILFIAQWLKWIFRRYYDAIYYWFFTDSNMFTWKLFLDELYLLVSCSCLTIISKFNSILTNYVSPLYSINILY